MITPCCTAELGNPALLRSVTLEVSQILVDRNGMK